MSPRKPASPTLAGQRARPLAITTTMAGSICSSPTTSISNSTRCRNSAKERTASFRGFPCSAAREDCRAQAIRSFATTATARSPTSPIRQVSRTRKGCSVWAWPGAISTKTATLIFTSPTTPEPNYLYQNNGDGTFSEIGLMSGAALSEDGKGQASMGVAIGDYDHRGRSNLFVTNFSDEYNAFYRHEKGFTFTDVSYATQTGRASLPYVGWGCGFFDYDNDGWLDLLVVNGHVYPQLATAKLKIAYAQRKLFYRNNRNGTFAEIAAEAGPTMNEPAASRGAAFGDLDNDGDVDVVINNLDGAPTILRNDGGNRNNFLVLELIGGGKSNRDAYGARVKVIAGDLVQIAERRSGGSYLSQNDTRLHFGLEKRTKIDSVEVRWPSGVTQKFMNPPVNSFIRIKEGDSAYNLIPYRKTK